MAKTKYDFYQETQYGRITYRDVPSYSPDFLGTTGDAVLVRQFIKNYLPFYKTSVTSSTGSSIRVKIVETAWFANYSGSTKNLYNQWLGDVIEPLFEGKGFDGMQDLEYSKPLPKLINTSDPNQDVSYGHNYIFVDNQDLLNTGYINLDDRRSGKGYSYQIFDGGNNVIKSGYTDIPAMMVRYIKGELTAPNEGDLVTLEKEEENPTFQRSFNYIEEDVLRLLNRGYALTLTEIDKFLTLSTPSITDAVVALQLDGYIDVVDPDKKKLKYELTQKGKNIFNPITGNIISAAATPTVPVSAVTLTMAQQEMVDFLALNGIVSFKYIKENFKKSPLFGRAELIQELISMNLVVADSQSPPLYQLTQLGYDSVSEVGTIPYLTNEQLKVLYALSLNEGQIAIGVKNLAVITDYPEDLVINVVNALEVFKLIDVFNNSNQVQKRIYAISKLGQEYLDKKNSQDKKANVASPTNANNNFTPLEQEIIDFLAIDDGMDIVIADFYQRFPNYDEDLIVNKVNNLVANDFITIVVNAIQPTGYESFYNLTTKGQNAVTPKNVLASFSSERLRILELFEEKTDIVGNNSLSKNNLIRTTNFDEYLINDILRDLIDLNFINQKKITNTSYIYNITELGKEFINGKKGNNSNLSEAKEKFIDSLTSADSGIYQTAVSDFMVSNADAFKTMGKEDPDLYTAILSGLSFVLGQQTIKDANLEPFKPLENQQQLEDDVILNDLISDDDLGDLDLDDLDLGEIDLSGLQEDIEINEDELGDLSDFDELKDFVENEIQNAPEVKLLPSQYNVLKVLYDNDKRFPMATFMDADSIGIVLKQDNIVYAHNQILKKLMELFNLELVKLKNDQKGGIMFSITDEGVEYVENNTKINVGQSQGALRPSPSESATINSVGAIKTGNDGNSWEVKENKNGVKRWVKI